MKTINRWLRILILLPFLFIIFNCQKDDAVDFNKSSVQEGTTQKIMSLDELKNLPLMEGRFSHIIKKDNDSVIPFYSAKYNFLLIRKG